MEVSAHMKGVRISSQKVRVVVNGVRGLKVGHAQNILTHSPKKASQLVKKLLDAAVANAENNEGLDIDDLEIVRISVDQGRSLKRMRPRAKGRSAPILKRSCHISVVVSDT